MDTLGLTASIKRITLCKQSPALSETFFQGEALGASPIERCSTCKSQISGCRLCSADQALLSAKAEEEYKIMGDHCQFDVDKGVLVAKYPLCKDPAILKDNGFEALGCQKSQERRQLSNKTHDLYVGQFQDMIQRNVVSPITEEEITSYECPVNYITHHEVYKDSNTTPICLVSNLSFRNGDTSLNECLV